MQIVKRTQCLFELSDIGEGEGSEIAENISGVVKSQFENARKMSAGVLLHGALPGMRVNTRYVNSINFVFTRYINSIKLAFVHGFNHGYTRYRLQEKYDFTSTGSLRKLFMTCM